MRKTIYGKRVDKGVLGSYELLFVILLITSGVAIRSFLLSYTGFYEGDVYFHYVVINQAISHNFTIQPVNYLSNHNGKVFEPDGFYYLTLLPYYTIQNYISLYNFLRVVPLFYVVLQFILFYMFINQLTENKSIRLIALALLVFSIGNISRTSALTYRGDGFVGIFILAALIFYIQLFKTKKLKHKVISGLISMFLLSICSLIWNGGGFAFGIFALSTIVVCLYGLYSNDNKMLKNSLILSISLFAYFGFITLYSIKGYIPYQTLTGFNLLSGVVIVNILIVLIYFLSFSLGKLNTANRKRLSTAIAAFFTILFALIMIKYATTSSIYNFFQNNNGSSIANLVVIELQPPPIGYIIASEGIVSLITPLFYPLFATTFLPLAYKWIPFIFIFAVAAFYFKASLRKKNESKESMIGVLSYFVIAGLLLIYAQRFTTILSIPASILEAYTIYQLAMQIKIKKFRSYLIIGTIIIQAIIAVAYSATLQPVNYVNMQFLQATNWINFNLPKNATIITFWPYGSTLEYYTNRTATEDSVGSQFTSNIFEQWLISKNESVAELGKLNASYMIFRYSMKNLYPQICTEALLRNCTGSFLNSSDTSLYRLASNHTIPGLTVLYRNNDTEILRVT